MSSRSEARKRGLVRIAQQRDAAEARAERLEGAIRLALATRVIEPYPAEILTAALAEKGDARDA